MTTTEWQEVRRLHAEEGVPKRELARRFGRDVKTIRRILGQASAPAARRNGRLDAQRVTIQMWLREDPEVTARAIWKRLRPDVGPVSERTVRKLVAALRTAPLSPAAQPV